LLGPIVDVLWPLKQRVDQLRALRGVVVLHEARHLGRRRERADGVQKRPAQKRFVACRSRRWNPQRRQLVEHMLINEVIPLSVLYGIDRLIEWDRGNGHRHLTVEMRPDSGFTVANCLHLTRGRYIHDRRVVGEELR
jgi:hypothetical protein